MYTLRGWAANAYPRRGVPSPQVTVPMDKAAKGRASNAAPCGVARRYPTEARDGLHLPPPRRGGGGSTLNGDP